MKFLWGDTLWNEMHPKETQIKLLDLINETKNIKYHSEPKVNNKSKENKISTDTNNNVNNTNNKILIQED